MEIFLIRFSQIVLVVGLQFIFVTSTIAGFLEMPEIIEMPELERESLLKDLDIPSVRDRDPDPESGPRLNVERFKLQGIVEYPELGITKADIDGLIEKIRSELMQEYKVLESGYTENELKEVTDMLVEIEKDTLERHVSDLEVQKLVWLVRDQRSRRGITLGTIETVADRITQFYRERGFILAKAYIPQQQVRDGVVTLTLLLGKLGEVQVNDNEHYNKRIISSVFDDALTLPVTNDITEENIYLINDFPGLSVLGFYEPGSQVGDTRLNLNVKSEQKYEANVRIDNHGSEGTGKNRLYAEGIANNLAGIADKLQVSALNSFSPDNTTYWQVKYSFNLFSPKWRFELGKTENQFLVSENETSALAQRELSGITTQSDAKLSYKLKRTRVENYTLDLAWDEVFSDLQLGNFTGAASNTIDDKVTNTTLKFNFDVLQEASKILHQGDISITSGEFLLGASGEQEEKYQILRSNYTLLSFVNIPFTDIQTRLIMRSSLQYSETPLSSVSQFSLGGPTRSRAYAVDLFSADQAVSLSVDWVFDLPGWMDFNVTDVTSLKDYTQPLLFLDASIGKRLAAKLDESDEKGRAINLGLGFRIFYLKNFQGNLQFAFPVSSKFGDSLELDPDDGVNVLFDFQYAFK